MRPLTQRRTPNIQAQLRRVAAIPVALLIGLWLAASGYLAYEAVRQNAVADVIEELSVPSGYALVDIAEERSAALAYLEDPEAHTREFAEAQSAADEAIGPVLGTLTDVSSYLQEPVVERIAVLGEHLDSLDELRGRIEDGDADRAEVLDGYNGVINAGIDLFEAQAREGHHPPAMVHGLSAIELIRAIDQLSLADGQLRRAFATGELSAAAQQEFTRLTGAYQTRLDAAAEHLGPGPTETWEDISGAPERAELAELTEAIIEREADIEVDQLTGEAEAELPMPVADEDWDAAFTVVYTDLIRLAEEQASYAAELTRADAEESAWVAALATLGLLAAVVAALLLARRTARAIARRLSRLRDSTQELAETRLPEIVERLSRGEAVDAATELPALARDDDEIGEVARSFDAAQRIAVQAAARQAELRHGANRAFVSVAHHSQALVQRQLRILDKLERDQEDPERLTDLFKLDHLATRSRRSTENLLIIGGEPLGRTRRQPVAMVDVLRAAMSESGDYSRINRQHAPRVALRGSAAPDVIHLVAELLDNGTTYSPPHTPVHLRAVEVANGVAIEVEDRGVGMAEHELAEVNAILADPPDFDVTHLGGDVRLGLIVVSRLANQHGVQVRLRTSPYGGVQAIVLLPPPLLAPDTPQALEEADGEPGERPVAAPVPEAARTLNRPADHEPVAVPPPPAPDPGGGGRPPLPRRVPRAGQAPRPMSEVTGHDAGEEPVEESERLRRMKEALAALRLNSPSGGEGPPPEEVER